MTRKEAAERLDGLIGYYTTKDKEAVDFAIEVLLNEPLCGKDCVCSAWMRKRGIRERMNDEEAARVLGKMISDDIFYGKGLAAIEYVFKRLTQKEKEDEEDYLESYCPDCGYNWDGCQCPTGPTG